MKYKRYHLRFWKLLPCVSLKAERVCQGKSAIRFFHSLTLPSAIQHCGDRILGCILL